MSNNTPLLQDIFAIDGARLLQVSFMNHRVDEISDDEAEALTMAILQQMSPTHQTGDSRVKELAYILGNHRQRIAQILDLIYVSEDMLYGVLNENDEKMVTRKYVIINRLCRLFTEHEIIKLKLEDTLTIGVLLTLLLGGFPTHLVNDMINEPELRQAIKIINSSVGINHSKLAYTEFSDVITTTLELFNRPFKHDAEYYRLQNTIDIAVTAIIVHMLLICLRKHRNLDIGISTLIWKNAHLHDDSTIEAAQGLLGYGLTRSLNIMLM